MAEIRKMLYIWQRKLKPSCGVCEFLKQSDARFSCGVGARESGLVRRAKSMLRRVLNGIAVAGMATALLAGTAAIQTASADFASDLNAALASGNPNQFAPAVVALAKANPDKGAQIGKAIGQAVDEDQAASAAGAIAGGVKNAQFSAALFQALAEYYPAVRADIAAAVIAADPSSEAAVAAALEEVNTAAGAGLLSNPGPGAAPVNVNSTVSDLQEAFIKTAGTTRLGNVRGGELLFAGPGGGTTSPTNNDYTPPPETPVRPALD